LYSAVVSIATVVVLVPALLLAAYYLLRVLTSEAAGPRGFFSRARYEAGNPPRGSPRPPVLYQYLGYVIAFVVLDPLFMILFTLPLVASKWGATWVGLNVAAGFIVVPPLFYALRYASRPELWSIREDEETEGGAH
jgi:NADH-quinone oxidoreductase subunit A